MADRSATISFCSLCTLNLLARTRRFTLGPTPPLVPHGRQPSLVPQGRRASDEDDIIDLLDDAEALEFVQFDPSVQDENAWEARKVINTFLEKYSLHPLAPEEREAIKKDFT